ncbi:CCT motif [Seminavis robusta]|uniref:CCT motif n=1 Tax=Seminavis robusta TaxID=568900 RepID=A0A9N8D943_9STRA|nr:CCT motif [Seminavis robusta]|eukprot:Sro47_g027630.1 CCT motif (737) ;mRNA; r:6116-8420
MKTRWFTRSQREQGSNGMLTSSERSAMLTDSERTRNESIDFDIDFSVTESGRTVAHMIDAATKSSNDGEFDFSITSSGRTIEHIMQDHAMNKTPAATRNNINDNNSNTTHSNNNTSNNSSATHANLPTGVPAVRATISNPLTIPPQAATKSPARAIPPPNGSLLHTNNNSSTNGNAHTGSQDSSGSNFLSGILNESPATSSAMAQLAHTPPTNFGTSYENRHFGKRQRSGSVSGRLRSASDLEEKGLIDRNQKGILKDLIICGDEELQKALDKYETGDPAELEHMIKSGALQNKAVPDLDLLGDLDLDLDFLTVNDGGGEVTSGDLGREGPGMYSLPQHTTNNTTCTETTTATNQRSASMPSIMQPPPPAFASKRQASDMTHNRTTTTTTNTAAGSAAPVTHEFDDGIGELEFTGGFGGDAYFGDDATSGQFMNSSGEKQRSLSTVSGDDNRLRSNSLFSALINEPRTTENHYTQYGRWMDVVPASNANNNTAHSVNSNLFDRKESVAGKDRNHQETTAKTAATTVSRPIPIPNASTKHESQSAAATITSTPTTSPKKKGRRKSDSAAVEERRLKAQLRQELAEQKRREKQEKREKKEREKQEKREARLLAKAEKKKLKEQKKDSSSAMAVDEEEKPIHVPGSGRPRSMSDPNLTATRDEFGHVEIERPDGWVGAYSPESRKKRIEKFLEKRHQRVWTKTVKYDVRKNFADSRLRVKGRFVKKEDEMLMRDLMSLT